MVKDQTCTTHILVAGLNSHILRWSNKAYRWLVWEVIRNPEGDRDIVGCALVVNRKRPSNFQEMLFHTIIVGEFLNADLVQTRVLDKLTHLVIYLILLEVTQIEDHCPHLRVLFSMVAVGHYI